MPTPTQQITPPGEQLRMEPDRAEVLTGTVDRIIFHNSQNGFCVFTSKPRGYHRKVTIVAHTPQLAAGQWITASGRWIHDTTYGERFRAEFLKLSEPTSLHGIEKYLASGMIQGIGPVFARKLVRAFGEQVFDVIEGQPDRLTDVPGIGAKRARSILTAWAEQKAVREIMVFLQDHGIGTTRAARIYRTYGTDAVATICENPYALIRDIPSVGFRTADEIAMKLGIPKDALVRVRAGIAFTLQEATGQGNCGLPEDMLERTATDLLEVDAAHYAQGLQAELAISHLVRAPARGRDCIFLRYLYDAERNVADRLRKLARGPLPFAGLDLERAVLNARLRTRTTLAPTQEDALRDALRTKVMVITGGPGVGKTTLVKSYLAALHDEDLAVSICAPTGRAAKRIEETTAHEAMTIHRLLEMNPRQGGFQRNASNPIPCDVLILDEASMVDAPLMRHLLDAVPDAAAVLVLGDVDQLPSVGPGQVLGDMIESGAVHTARLTEIYRQARESHIITAAHRINEGVAPDLSRPDDLTDFYFVTARDPEGAARTIVSLVQDHIPRRFGLDPVDDIQVLTPMNRGNVGTHSLNALLQPALNPRQEPRVQRYGVSFVPGNKVMQTENDYDKMVFNGDIGFVDHIDENEGKLWVLFDGDHFVPYTYNALDTLVPAYAITIHKSQGSEYPAIVVPVTTQHYPMLQRSLLYTAVTRGKSLVVLVGQPKALHIAVKNATTRKRWSKLGEWLAAA